jgi:hypothetical protein
MARRKHRRNPRAKYKVRHVVLKKNPRRRLRRNGPEAAASVEADAALAAIAGGETSSTAAIMAAEAGRSDAPARFDFSKKRGWKSDWAKAIKREEANQRKRVSSALERSAKAQRRAAKRAKGTSKRAHSAQAARLSALAAVVRDRGRNKALKSPLIKAMTLKSNGSLMESAKLIAPVALVGAGGLVGLTLAGKYIAEMLVMEKDKAGNTTFKKSFLADEKDPSKGASTLGKYSPALATAALSAVAFVVADKVAPRYKGAIAIGGMIGAIVQAVGAAAMDPSVKDDSLLGKAKKALSLGEYTTVGGGIFHGVGEYTTVGSGIFRGVGEYTTVGQAHPFRPRNYGDTQMEWAATGGLGLLEDRGGHDNATEFAPGEGGIFTKMPMLSR